MKQHQGTFHNHQLHRVFQYIKMCVLIRHTFCESLVKIADLHKKNWKIQQTTIINDRITVLTDRHFLFLCLYMIHLGLKPFLLAIAKICLLKSNPNVQHQKNFFFYFIKSKAYKTPPFYCRHS